MGKPKKLEGRKNFDEWKVEAKAYLATKGHWKCFDGAEVDQDKNFLAIQMLNLLLTPQLYTYTADCTDAKTAWEAICGAFEESGIGRRVDVLKQLVDLRQVDCESMEEYVHKMSMLSAKVKKAGLEIGDEVVAALMLAGLPIEYRPMVMAMENSTTKLTTDYVKNRLLQEVGDETSNDAALVARHKKKGHNLNKNRKCFVCNKEGHFANKCPNKVKHTRNEQQMLLCSYMAKSNTHDWYVDSGASAHMAMSDEALCDVRKPIKKEITVGDNSKLEVKQVGDINISLGSTTAKVNDVLHIPGICANLMSVSQMAKRGCTLVFDKNCCKIYNDDKVLIASAPLINELYKLNCSTIGSDKAWIAADHNLWHRRFGHPCDANLDKVKAAVEGVAISQSGDSKGCHICVKAKLTRASFKDKGSRATCALEIVHSDVAFMPHKSMGGAKCFVTFIDDYTRKVFLFPMKQKNEVFDIFVRFKEFAEKQSGKNIKILRSDNGREYCNNRFKTYLSKNGILHQLTVPYSPEQNGVAERMNRTIVEKIRCMLLDANLGKSFWAEAAVTASHLINLTPCRGHVDSTPEQLWSGLKPNASELRVFGCKAYVHIPKEQRSKLQSKATEAIMIGYSEQSKAYRLFDIETRKIIICKDARFFETSQVSHENKNINQFVSSRMKDRADNAGSGVNNNNQINNTKRNSCFNKCNDVGESESEDSDGDNAESGSDDDNESNYDSNCRNDDGGGNAGDDEHANSEFFSDEGSVHEVTLPNIETIVLGPDSESDNQLIDITAAAENTTAEQECRSSGSIKRDNEAENFNNMRAESTEENYSGSAASKSECMYALLAAAEEDIDEPKNYNEAKNSTDSQHWEKAMKAEYQSLIENNTWKLCELPPGRKAIDSRWVYKLKRNAMGDIDRYKARLVIKGFSQIKGIDFDETYSPVVRYTSIRFLLAMAAKYKMVIHQMDAITAFLQGDLTEEIYMNQPIGIDDNTGRVCRLQKALYGLKQSSRVWNQKLNDVLVTKMKFERSEIDRCIYYKRSQQNLLVLAVWVDDVMIFSTNATMCTKLKKNLCTFFKMKDLGAVSSLLGMHITFGDNGSISINQRAYLSTVIRRFNMEDCNPVSTPLDYNQKLSQEMCPKTDAERRDMAQIPYQEAVGCIMYAAQISRPDICFAINMLSRYNSNFGSAHWNAVKRVLRYIKGSLDYKLTYDPRSDQSEIIGFCDADWAGDLDQRRSTTGYVFKGLGGAISWSTRRQPTIALSTTEAEFMSLSAATQEALWLKRLECEFLPSAPRKICIFCDNQGAILLAKNRNYHARTKHIDVRKYFIQEHIQTTDGEEIQLEIKYMPTNEMIADILTKAVNSTKLEKHISAFGLE